MEQPAPRMLVDRHIGFRLRPLHQVNPLALLLERVEDQPLIAELICNGQIAIDLLKQIFQRARMSPRQQTIQIPDLGIQLIVSLRPDGYDAVRAEQANIWRHF